MHIKNNRKAVLSFVLFNFFLIVSMTAAYAWFFVYTGKSFEINIGSKDINIIKEFAVNSENPSYNRKNNIVLKNYDPYIQANNFETNAIYFVELSLYNITTMSLSFSRFNILDIPGNSNGEAISLADVGFFQLFCDQFAYTDTDDLYSLFNLKFADTATYPKYKELTLDSDNPGPEFTFNFTASENLSVCLVINFDYDQEKITHYLGDTGDSYNLANLGDVPIYNNLNLHVFGE